MCVEWQNKRGCTNSGSTASNMKEKQHLWLKGERVKLSKCLGICAVGVSFKGCFVQQCVGIMKSYDAYTVKPSWPQISVEVLYAEVNGRVLPVAEHWGGSWQMTLLCFWGLWINTPISLAYDITLSGPWGCEFLRNAKTAGGGVFHCTLMLVTAHP